MAKVTGRFDGLKIVKEGVKNGKAWKLYNIVVDGKKYGFGFKPAKAAVGDTVSFRAEENANGYLEAIVDSFEVVQERTITGGSDDAASPPATRSSGSDPKQESIETQCALKAAAWVVAAQVAAGVTISSPTAAVAVLTTDFKHIIRGTHGQKPAPKPAPKRIEPEDESQDPPFDEDESLPY